MKVLLIDDIRTPDMVRDPDDEDNRNYSLTGHEITIMRNGEEGCEALTNNKYDILLLDHDMGHGMTGMGVIRFLQDNPQLMPKKIYLVTANIVMGPVMMENLQRWHRENLIERYAWIM